MSLTETTKVVLGTTAVVLVVNTGVLAGLYRYSEGFRNFCGRKLGVLNDQGLIEATNRVQDIQQQIAAVSGQLEGVLQDSKDAQSVIATATILQEQTNEELKVTNLALDTLASKQTQLLKAVQQEDREARERELRAKEQIERMQQLLPEVCEIAKTREELTRYKGLLRASSTHFKELQAKYEAVLAEKLKLESEKASKKRSFFKFTKTPRA